MPEKLTQEMTIDPLAILGFGFVGLAFLMAFLGYRTLNQVIAAPNPRENVVKLARLYLFVSLALLVAAGPLQLGLLWAQSAFAPKPVKLTIGLASTTWEKEAYGDVGIMRGGQFLAFFPNPLVNTFEEGDELNIQLDKVAKKIDLIKAQIIAVKDTRVETPTSVIETPPPSDPAAAAQAGG